MREPLLKVENLTASYRGRKGSNMVLNKVGFELFEGEKVAIVGESGSGKSTLAAVISRLMPANLVIESGRVLYKGKDILSMDDSEFDALRGREISIVLQNPSTSLDPLYPVGDQIAEALIENGMDKKEAREEAIRLMEMVGIPQPKKRYKAFPHQLSGGQKQRIAIAIALSLKPKLLIADEPTSALDLSTQTQIIELLKKFTTEFKTALILITHDIGIAHDISDRIIVMYGGEIMEIGETREVISSPMHPYTQHLLASVPADLNVKKLPPKSVGENGLSQTVSSIGCPFRHRCPLAEDPCYETAPELLSIGSRKVACFLYKNLVMEHAKR